MSLFETVRLSVSISPRNLYNSLKSIKEEAKIRIPRDFDFTDMSLILYEISSYIQSTLVISKSKEPSETVRDIRTLTYQICRVEIKYK